MINLDKIRKNQIKKISNSEGDIIKILSQQDQNYKGFGELYTSSINNKTIKAWKCHQKMTLNLRVILGEVKFVFSDGKTNFKEFILSSKDLFLITVPPKIWYGFEGLDEFSLILNLTDLVFDENEILRKKIKDIKYDW